MKASPISCDETMAVRRRATLSLSPSLRERAPDALVDELAHGVGHAGRRRHGGDARGERRPVPSAWSHMVRKPYDIVPGARVRRASAAWPSLTCLGSKGSAMAATKRLALPSK